jgi:uncharacterized protein YyaL (SSP411 family)
MLYDQAQLALAFLEAAQVSGDDLFRDVAVDTLRYVARDLRHPEGGFYSAEDADSVPPEAAGDPHAHRLEGAFYVWRDEEIGEALGADAEVFRLRYGIRPGGNAPFDPQGEFAGANLLYTARGHGEVAAATGRSEADVQAAVARSRRLLLERRGRRPRPHLDDKVLAGWNGLMIAAFARASRVLREDVRLEPRGGRPLELAQQAAAFVRTHLWDAATRTLLRRFREGAAGLDAFAEDYAYLAFGLVELFQADGDPAWLEWALVLQRRMDDLFWDRAAGAWFSTTGADGTVLLRLKEEYDGAEPSASAVGVLNLLTIAHLAEEDSASRDDRPQAVAERIDAALAAFADRVAVSGRAIPMLLAALSSYHAGVSQLAIVGAPDDADAQRLRDAAAGPYLPFTVMVPIVPEHRDALARLLPWTGALPMGERGAAAFLCRAFVCEAPATTAPALASQLRTRRAPVDGPGADAP